MASATYTVKGMTCDHCVRAVREEVEGVAGVSAVDVQLEGGQMTVASEGDIDTDAVRAAVVEAGYELVES